MAKTKKAPKKPRNYKANEATFLNIDPLKRRVAELEATVKALSKLVVALQNHAAYAPKDDLAVAWGLVLKSVHG